MHFYVVSVTEAIGTRENTAQIADERPLLVACGCDIGIMRTRGRMPKVIAFDLMLMHDGSVWES